MHAFVRVSLPVHVCMSVYVDGYYVQRVREKYSERVKRAERDSERERKSNCMREREKRECERE